MGLIGKLFGGSQPPEPPENDVYLGLRNQALKVTTASLEVEADPKAPILAVLMEMGLSDAVATFACFRDGSVSLYLSTGGGFIGGGGHESVRSACLEMLSLTNKYANDFIAACTPASHFPFPGEGEIFFYLVTSGAVHLARCREDALSAQRDPFSALYNNCHAVMTELRQIEENRQSPPTS